MMQVVRSKCIFPIGEIVNEQLGIKVNTGCLSKPDAGSKYCSLHKSFIVKDSTGEKE